MSEHPPEQAFPQVEHIPDELRQLPQWVNWRFETIPGRQGKWTKIPYRSNCSRSRASATDSECWSSFDEALRACRTQASLDGIGFVFSLDSGFTGVDLDRCIDQETGEILPWAFELLRKLDSYCEISPSGTGVKAIVSARIPRDSRGECRHKRTGFGPDGVGAVEMYDDARYFTITGRRIEEFPAGIQLRQEQLQTIYSRLWPPEEPQAPAHSDVTSAALADQELIELARGFKNGADFSALYDHGDLAPYHGDTSAADLALCSHLAFVCGNDPPRIARLFHSSALGQRDKWTKRADYRHRTIAKALSGMSEFYSPPIRWTAGAAQREEGFSNDHAPDQTSDDTALTPVVAGQELPPVEDQALPFPLHVFPTPVARFIEEAAVALPCPPDFLALPLLALAGSAIGTSRELVVKPGWTEGTRLYTAVVAEPGSRKSPALGMVSAPLHKRQAELSAKFRRELEEYQQALVRYEIELATWKESAKKSARSDQGISTPPEKPEEPILEQVYTTDTTMEALATVLYENQRGAVLLRDELTAWAASMNQYRAGKGADRQYWLSFWSGAPVLINRKTRKEPIDLQNPFVAVTGCLPPDVLGDLADERGRQDGFIHRILFAYPQPIQVEWTDSYVSDEAQASLLQLFKGLWALQPSSDAEGRPTPLRVPFTKGGQRLFAEWANAHYHEASDPLFPENLRGPWAKLDGYCARLALILHACRLAFGEAADEGVDEQSVQRAFALVAYFKSHTRQVYSQLRVTEEDKQVLQAVAWIKKQGGTTTVRQLLRNHVAGVKNATGCRTLLRELADRGLGTLVVGEKKSESFSLHPKATGDT